MRTQYSPGLVLVLGLAALVTPGCAQKAAEEPMQHTARKVPTETLEPKAENEPGAVATAKGELERSVKAAVKEF